MKRWHPIEIALTIAILLLPGVSLALTEQQEALVGLKGVRVFVEEMDSKTALLDINKDQIQSDVELRLRKAGVMVLTEKERLEAPGQSYISVNVSAFSMAVRGQRAGNAYNINVTLYEAVTLARGFETLGAIWQIGYTGVVGTSVMRAVRDNLGDLVDTFINDYLAANPKK